MDTPGDRAGTGTGAVAQREPRPHGGALDAAAGGGGVALPDICLPAACLFRTAAAADAIRSAGAYAADESEPVRPPAHPATKPTIGPAGL